MIPIRKRSTAAMVAANRANSLKSTGPVTEPGKMQARLNALKHGAEATAAGPCLPELGERIEDLKSLQRKFQLTFHPSDEFELMLMLEMVENRWRRRRVLRAEAGILAAQRMSFELDYGRKIAGDGRSTVDAGASSAAAKLGLVALPDSSAKFNLILQTLRAAQEAVEREGFTETGLRYLEGVYGPDPGLAGAAVLARCRQHLENSAAAIDVSAIDNVNPDAATAGLDTGQQALRPAEAQPDTSRRDFLELLAAEIACFEKLLEIHEKGSEDLARAQWDAQNSLSDADARRILRHETFLDRQFERLLKQFHQHREAGRQDLEALYSGAPPSRIPAMGPTRTGFDPLDLDLDLKRAFGGAAKPSARPEGSKGEKNLKPK